jgi:hypothetical protein
MSASLNEKSGDPEDFFALIGNSLWNVVTGYVESGGVGILLTAAGNAVVQMENMDPP